MSAEFQFVEFKLSSTSVHGRNRKCFGAVNFKHQPGTGLGPWLNSRSHSTRCRRSLWMGSAGGKTSQLTRDKQSVSHSATPFPSKSNREANGIFLGRKKSVGTYVFEKSNEDRFFVNKKRWHRPILSAILKVGPVSTYPRWSLIKSALCPLLLLLSYYLLAVISLRSMRDEHSKDTLMYLSPTAVELHPWRVSKDCTINTTPYP